MSTPDTLGPLVTHHHTDDGERSFLDVRWGERRIQIHRSPAGRSIRVWLDGAELKPPRPATAT